MSTASSNSPALRLQIGNSRSHTAAAVVLGGAFGASLVLLAVQGHVMLTAALALLLWRLLPGCPSGGLRDAVIEYRAGHWSLRRGPLSRTMVLVRHNAPLSRAVYVVFRDAVTDEVECGWVFADSVGVQDWRRLRVRLALCGAGISADSCRG